MNMGSSICDFDIEIYAYVLMDNHYHLLRKTLNANLSKAMQWFGTCYTQAFNMRNKKSGHLFQGRFKSIVVENDAYLFTHLYIWKEKTNWLNTVMKDTEPWIILNKALEILGFDINAARQSKKIDQNDKDHRDLIIYLLKQTGRYSNNEIGDFFWPSILSGKPQK